MLSPGATIGIVGGGQLGRMLALAAAPLGLKCHVLAPDADSPAFQVSAVQTVAAYDDGAALARLADAVDVITYEFENVDVDVLRPYPHVHPGVAALEASQDRLLEKTFLRQAGCPVPRFFPVDDPASLAAALAEVGEGILKTRRFGYDGKGQCRVRVGDDPVAAFNTIGAVPAILEERVGFDYEVSTVVARGIDGTLAFYDEPRNVHRDGILHTSTLPSPLPDRTRADLRAMAAGVAQALNYVGVFAIEWFVLEGGGRVLANEMAPRVHNTGHWTMDAALTSQFENHIRAIAGWPLGSTVRTAEVEMLNLIGDEVDGWSAIARAPDKRLHLYGKAEARSGRKMGHVNSIRAAVDFDPSA